MSIENLEDLDSILSKYSKRTYQHPFYGSIMYELEYQNDAEEIDDKQNLFNQIRLKLEDLCVYELHFDLNNNDIYNERYDIFSVWNKIIILIDVDSLENNLEKLKKVIKIDDIGALDLQVTIPPDIIQNTWWLQAERR